MSIPDYVSYYQYCRHRDNLFCNKPFMRLKEFQYETSQKVGKTTRGFFPSNITGSVLNTEFDLQYQNAVSNLNNKLNTAVFDNEVDQTISYKAIPDLSDCHNEIDIICKKIVPSIESCLYGCYLAVHRAYLYQNYIDNEEDKTDELNNNKWHWDNTPSTIINIVVYLSDVSESDSHLEIMVNSKNNNAVTMPTNRLGLKMWGNNTHMRYKNCILNG